MIMTRKHESLLNTGPKPVEQFSISSELRFVIIECFLRCKTICLIIKTSTTEVEILHLEQQPQHLCFLIELKKELVEKKKK